VREVSRGMVRAVGDGSMYIVSCLPSPAGVSGLSPCSDLANQHEPLLRVYSTGDGPDVYQDSFMKIARGDGGTFHPTLILVGTRLGIDKVTPVYWDALIAALQLPQSVGIAGYLPGVFSYSRVEAD
jgi:hypothetical protein